LDGKVGEERGLQNKIQYHNQSGDDDSHSATPVVSGSAVSGSVGSVGSATSGFARFPGCVRSFAGGFFVDFHVSFFRGSYVANNLVSSNLGLLSVAIILPSLVLMMYWELHPANPNRQTSIITAFITLPFFTLTLAVIGEA
jgi:hypothetical protein